MLAVVRSWLQVVAVSTVDCTFIGWAGPRSWYCCCPCTVPSARTLALPPKLARSLLLAMIQPASVIVTSHSCVLAGGVHVFSASPKGSVGSCVPVLCLTAAVRVCRLQGYCFSPHLIDMNRQEHWIQDWRHPACVIRHLKTGDSPCAVRQATPPAQQLKICFDCDRHPSDPSGR